MALSVAEIALVSPLGSSPSEHVFFHRAEVNPHASGAFTTRDGEALPVHHCPWIAASRPWSSRIRLLAKQALARAAPGSRKTPILLVAPREALEGEADVARFLTLAGHAVVSQRSGAAGYVMALKEAEDVLRQDPEVVVLAVDSRIHRPDIERWLEMRYSAFTRNPLPPSEGAAAMRLVAGAQAPLAGKVHSYAVAESEARDDNDLPTDGAALTRVFAALRLRPTVPLVVGPRDVDPLRIRDFHLASVRHHARLQRAEMPSFEGQIGALGSAAGLMSAVFALAWLRHGLPLPGPARERVALAWARSPDGTVGAALVGDERS
ncbi:hypothetical protein WMF11_17935 [Sorangium sp. So ce295]|uniref:hypothetical protein n=1 Tax=Sorangium sp. So ce295 TaxID=3133295 RepID=UPI003F619527